MNHTLELRTDKPTEMARTDTITVHTNHGIFEFNGAQLKVAQTLLTVNVSAVDTMRDIRTLNGWPFAHAKALVDAAKVFRVSYNVTNTP